MRMSTRLTRVAFATTGTIVLALTAAACGGGDDTAKVDDETKDTRAQRLASLTKRLGAHAAVARRAGCEMSAPEEAGAEHVREIDPDNYTSSPPSSGEHFADWAPWGYYDEPVDDGYVVHNLEHGGVALWYGNEALAGPRAAIVRDEVLDDHEKWIVVPDEDLDGIAAAAWGTVLDCSQEALGKLDDDAFTGLLDAWYAANHSRGTEVEKDVPSYAGAMAEPRPERDISRNPPESFGGS